MQSRRGIWEIKVDGLIQIHLKYSLCIDHIYFSITSIKYLKPTVVMAVLS